VNEQELNLTRLGPQASVTLRGLTTQPPRLHNNPLKRQADAFILREDGSGSAEIRNADDCLCERFALCSYSIGLLLFICLFSSCLFIVPFFFGFGNIRVCAPPSPLRKKKRKNTGPGGAVVLFCRSRVPARARSFCLVQTPLNVLHYNHSQFGVFWGSMWQLIQIEHNKVKKVTEFRDVELWATVK